MIFIADISVIGMSVYLLIGVPLVYMLQYRDVTIHCIIILPLLYHDAAIYCTIQ